MKVSVAGLFKFEAHKVNPSDPEKIVSSRLVRDWINNLILDAGLERIGTDGFLSHAMVGGSSAAPLAGQTALVTPIASTATRQNTTYGTELASNYCYVRRTFRFAIGVAQGNLSEVGVGWSTSACFSRALIVDTLGDPTTITIEPDEVLDVTYELRVYWPTTDVTGTITLDGANYDVVARAATVGNWQGVLQQLIDFGADVISVSVVAYYTGGNPGNLGAITATPGGSGLISLTPSVNGAYSNGSRQRNFRVIYDVNESAQNSVSAMMFQTACGIFKASFSPSIPKDNTKTLTIDYHVSWARKVI